MIIPWDFGIINAIKEQLGMLIFPSSPAKHQQIVEQNPQIIFELKDILQGKNLLYRITFTLTLIDNNEGTNLMTLKNISKIIRKELTLKQGNAEIGSARGKIEGINNKQNTMTINCSALLKLKTIYEDDDEEQEDE